MSEEIRKLPQALCTGDDTFNGVKLTAAILDDDDRTHVFSERSLAKAFGFRGSGAYWRKKKTDSALLPEFLSIEIFNQFISSELRIKLQSALSYISTSKIIATGLEATVLPLICDVFVKAAKEYPENENLRKAADVAYHIILAFSQYGVLKWVEQITGYRYTDENTVIVQQLKEFGVSPIILDWQKEFQADFYRHIYRLKGWPFNPNTVKRPQVIGTYTNQYVYNYLPKDVFAWIKQNTPKSKAGNRTARYFQSLDDKTGKEKLRNQMVSVTTMLKLSKSWQQFKDFFAQSLGQTQIDFEDPKMVLPEPKLLVKAKEEAINNQQSLFDEQEHLKRIEKASFNQLLSATMKVPNPKNDNKDG